MMKRALTKQACDICSRKKRKCSGDSPCQRCRRAGVQCTYSAKAVGRSRSTADAHATQPHQPVQTKRAPPATHTAPEVTEVTATPSTASPAPSRLPTLTVSPATGLHGLQESKFLSVFLEHCAPMYPIADDASIRDGLMHEFVGLCNKDSQDSLRGPEAMRGQALSCALFSCIAIGGLMAGCPPAAVSPHLTTAQASLSKFAGLEDVYAVRAYALYAMAREFGGGLGPGTEYRKGMEAARAIFEKLPATEKEPILSAVLSHFMVLEGLPQLQHVEIEVSKKDGMAPPGRGGRGGGDSKSAAVAAAARERNSGTSYVCCKTAHEEAIFQKALATRADVSLVMSPKPPPAYVVTDATLLTIRFSRDRGDVATRLLHLHDFASSELARFKQEESGAVAILAILSPLMGVKIRLGRLDGLLPAAETASALFQTCPGLARIYHRHVAHQAMAVYKLYGRRQSYETLRQLLTPRNEQEVRTFGGMAASPVPAFEDMTASARFCHLPLCAMHLEKLLKMDAPQQSGGGGGGGGGAAGAGRLTGMGCRGGGGLPGAGPTNSGGPGDPAAMAAQQSRQRTGRDGFSAFDSPPFPSSSSSSSTSASSSRQGRLLEGASRAGASNARANTRQDMYPAVPAWGYPAEGRGDSRPLLPPAAAPRNPLAAPRSRSESTDFAGTQQSFGAVRNDGGPPSAGNGPYGSAGPERGPPGGFPEVGFGATDFVSASPANDSSDEASFAEARREQASGRGVPNPARDYQGDGSGGGGGGGSDVDASSTLTRDVTGLARVEGWGGQMPTRDFRDDRSASRIEEASPSWIGGGLPMPAKHSRGSSGGDGGEGGGKRGRTEVPLSREGQGQRGYERSDDRAASSLPGTFPATTSNGAATPSPGHSANSSMTAADLLSLSYSIFGEDDDPSRPPLG